MNIDTPLIETNNLLTEFFNPDQPTGITIQCTKNFNCGFPTITATMSLFEAFQYTDVSNDRMEEDEQSNRPLDLGHAKAIAQYILKAILKATERIKRMKGEMVPDRLMEMMEELGMQAYYTIPPLVANLRNLRVGDIRAITDRNNDVVGYKVILQSGDVLWVIDGQHRRKAMELVFNFLNDVTSNHKYSKGSIFPGKISGKLPLEEVNIWNSVKETSKYCTVTVESHIGISIDQERQLFNDLNTKGKKIETSLALKFDTSNPVNFYIKDHLIPTLQDEGFSISDRDDVNWDEEVNAISRQVLSAINSVLFLNKTSIKTALPSDVTAVKKQIAEDFWNLVINIPGFKESRFKQKTAAAQPVVLKALAKLYFDAFSGKGELHSAENQLKLVNGIKTFDFSHANPAWRYYQMNKEDRTLNGLDGLDAYLPLDEPGKVRDLGVHDGSFMRFARTHNDVFPLIADIIRWHSDLPSRAKIA